MAGKPRFRIPTLEEMEKADSTETVSTARPLFRQDTESKSTEGTASKPADSVTAQVSPPKRIISQKALLSRQPLSSARTKKTPKKNDLSQSSSESESSAAASRLEDVLGHHRVSRVTEDNVNRANLKSSAGSPTVAETVSTKKLDTQVASGKSCDVSVSSVTPHTDSANGASQSESVWEFQAVGTVAMMGSGDRSFMKSSCLQSSSDQDSISPRKATVSETSRSGQGQDCRKASSIVQREAEQSGTAASQGGTAATLTSLQPAQPHKTADSTTSHSEQTATGEDDVRADVLPTLAKLGKTNSLVVSSRQRGNPILNYVRNVPWEYGNIVPDYVMGQGNCALYLSLRYHQLHPEYIHNRLKQLGHSFELRVLLVQVDIKDPHHLLKDLAKICILADCTLMLAFSAEEAGRYLETYKVYENKAAEAIMERTESSFGAQLSDCLTRVKSVNKTDCSTLLATFGSLQGIMNASTEDMSLCPGFGPQKAKRLHDVFREPFLVSKKQRGESGK